ncbi:MAG: hypothetical protein NVS3B14_14530 [Ktedonobacteraceae bacterium]
MRSVESLIFEKGAPGRRAATMTDGIAGKHGSREHAAQGAGGAARGERN